MAETRVDCTRATTEALLGMTLRAIDPLMRTLDVVPESRLGEQPVPEQLPLGKMVEHALGAVAFTARAIRLGKCDESDVADLMRQDEATGTAPRIREVEAITRSEIEATLSALDEEVAGRTIPYWFGWELTAFESASIGYQELVHHRGQVQSFLRLMGFEPPAIDESEGEDDGSGDEDSGSGDEPAAVS